MQQLKFNNRFSTDKEYLKKKSATMDELLNKEEIKNIIETLNVDVKEFDYYLGKIIFCNCIGSADAKAAFLKQS